MWAVPTVNGSVISRHPCCRPPFSEQLYFDFFEERRGDLVYLCAESPNELQEVDPGKIYIIGGLVDRNR